MHTERWSPVWSTRDPDAGTDELSISARSAKDLSEQSSGIITALQALAELIRFSLPSFGTQSSTILIAKIGAKTYRGARINEAPGLDDVSISIGSDFTRGGAEMFNANFKVLLDRWVEESKRRTT